MGYLGQQPKISIFDTDSSNHHEIKQPKIRYEVEALPINDIEEAPKPRNTNFAIKVIDRTTRHGIKQAPARK